MKRIRNLRGQQGRLVLYEKSQLPIQAWQQFPQQGNRNCQNHSCMNIINVTVDCYGIDHRVFDDDNVGEFDVDYNSVEDDDDKVVH